jgi:hypothetical protein
MVHGEKGFSQLFEEWEVFEQVLWIFFLRQSLNGFFGEANLSYKLTRVYQELLGVGRPEDLPPVPLGRLVTPDDGFRTPEGSFYAGRWVVEFAHRVSPLLVGRSEP